MPRSGLSAPSPATTRSGCLPAQCPLCPAKGRWEMLVCAQPAGAPSPRHASPSDGHFETQPTHHVTSPQQREAHSEGKRPDNQGTTCLQLLASPHPTQGMSLAAERKQ